MNLELILWIVGGVIIWEVIFLIALKLIDFDGSWILGKIFCFFVTLCLLMLQKPIVFSGCNPDSFFELSGCTANYHYLVYEVLIIGFIILFFYGNKKLYNYYNKKGKKKKK